jgi:hypothetical protein
LFLPSEHGRIQSRSSRAGYVSVDFVVLRDGSLLRMWATDINVGPGPSLAAFQLFDFLAAGAFKPRSGVYVVGEGSVTVPTGGLNSSEPSDGRPGSGSVDLAAVGVAQERCFVSCDLLRHPGIASMDYGGFFNACKAVGLAFDMDTRTGTAILVIDGSSCGAMGIVCVGESHCAAMAMLKNALELLDSSAVAAAPDSRVLAGSFRATLSTITFLAERLGAAGSTG